MKKLIFTICSVLCLCILTTYSVFGGIVYAEGNASKVDAKSACLIDFNSGEILYEQNAGAKLPVASMVKLMTILLAFEEIEKGNLSLDDMISTTENASKMGGSQAFIDPFVEYRTEDLLKSIIISSANDASVAIAEKISGSETEFVSKMNKRAKELGLNGTLYANATGLPAPMQFSCARDISVLNRQLLSHKDYHKYSTIWMDKLVHPSGRETELVNTNKLIRYFKGCDGGKTGSTIEAGYCLSATAQKDDMRLISTVIGAKDGKSRFSESASLLNYGFANFKNEEIISSNKKICDLMVKRSSIKSIEVMPKESFYGIIKKGENAKYSYDFKPTNQNVKAPIKRGDVVGNIQIIKDGVLVKEVEAISASDAEAYTIKDSYREIRKNWTI